MLHLPRWESVQPLACLGHKTFPHPNPHPTNILPACWLLAVATAMHEPHLLCAFVHVLPTLYCLLLPSLPVCTLAHCPTRCCCPVSPAGYIGSLSLLQAVAAVAQELRRVNPHLTYGEQEVYTIHMLINIPAQEQEKQEGGLCDRPAQKNAHPTRVLVCAPFCRFLDSEHRGGGGASTPALRHVVQDQLHRAETVMQ